jgi:hypothetical protein
MPLIPENLLKLMSPADRRQYGRAGWTLAEVQERVDGRLERKEHVIVVSWCALNEIPCRHDRTDRKTTGNLGWPDFTIIYAGNALLGEMKIGRNKLSTDQTRVIGTLSATGTSVQIWYSGAEAIESIKTWLQTLGWKHKRL